jgi:hypothetical protein
VQKLQTARVNFATLSKNPLQLQTEDLECTDSNSNLSRPRASDWLVIARVHASISYCHNVVCHLLSLFLFVFLCKNESAYVYMNTYLENVRLTSYGVPNVPHSVSSFRDRDRRDEHTNSADYRLFALSIRRSEVFHEHKHPRAKRDAIERVKERRS